MKWSDVMPGDMIVIGNDSFLKNFGYDMFLIVGIQETFESDSILNVQVLTRGSGTRKHQVVTNDIDPVFSVIRKGVRI